MIDPDFARARRHVIRHCPMPPTATPRADILDGEFDHTLYIMGPLAAIKLGRDLQQREIEGITTLIVTDRRETEHWATEQVKRAIIAAIVEHSKTGGMAVASRRAADQIIHLLRPADEHRAMEG